MNCPYCGYDKIQSNFNFCPFCQKPLNEKANTMETPHASQQNPNLHEKGFINRAFSRWTYERAIADPYSYAIWAYKNPNDNRYFLNKWMNEGNDTSIIRNAIAERQKQATCILNESVKEIISADALPETMALENNFFSDAERGHIRPPKEAEEFIRKGEEGKILVEDMANIAKRNLENLREQMLEYTHKNRCTKNEQ